MTKKEFDSLSIRAKTVLRSMGITSEKNFKTPTKEEILKTRNGGLRTVAELKKMGHLRKSKSAKKPPPTWREKMERDNENAD